MLDVHCLLHCCLDDWVCPWLRTNVMVGVIQMPEVLKEVVVWGLGPVKHRAGWIHLLCWGVVLPNSIFNCLGMCLEGLCNVGPHTIAYQQVRYVYVLLLKGINNWGNQCTSASNIELVELEEMLDYKLLQVIQHTMILPFLHISHCLHVINVWGLPSSTDPHLQLHGNYFFQQWVMLLATQWLVSALRVCNSSELYEVGPAMEPITYS